jgi:integrase
VTATIRITRDSKVIHTESKTFSKSTSKENEKNAQRWAKKREAELEVHGVPQLQSSHTLAEIAERYLDDPHQIRLGRTKKSDIKKLRHYPIAQRPIDQLSSRDYTDLINWRLTEVQPQTAANDLVWIKVLLEFAAAELGAKANIQELDATKDYLRSVGKIARSTERNRLPTVEEMQKILSFFAKRRRKSSIPMLDIILFALYSTRRLAEITRIEWADNDPVYKTGIVRDAKHPRTKEGNHLVFIYGEEAWEIMQRQHTDSPYIFPYNPKTISAIFTRTCKVLGINDLHFQDFRHWGVSEKFIIKGLHIHEVAEYSLHESWQTLKRYTHFSPKQRALVQAVHELIHSLK